MRKETKDIAEAFAQGKACKRRRTHTDGNTVWLHGNRIVWRDEVNPNITYYTLAGWGTVTTRERLNGIAQVLGHPISFWQQNHEQHVSMRGRDGTYEGETYTDDVWAIDERVLTEATR